MTSTDRRQALFFFAIAFFVLAAGFGLRDPWPADEPRFVLVAKQMVESGDFLFPHRGGELYPDKPPFYFWLLSAAYGVVGSWRWSFLLPSLLSGLGVLWLVQDLGRRLWSPRAGLWAAIAVAVALQFVYQGKRAQIDPTLVFMTTLSFYGLCRHLLGEELRLPQATTWWLGQRAERQAVLAERAGDADQAVAFGRVAVRAQARRHGIARHHLGQGEGDERHADAEQHATISFVEWKTPEDFQIKLMEVLQREYRVTLAGPTTLMAMLNSLQMGFRTLALEKRSSEVWQVLGAVKTEFGKFGDVLSKVKAQTQTVLNTLDNAETRSRAMGRALKAVEALPQEQASALLPLDPNDTGDA